MTQHTNLSRPILERVGRSSILGYYYLGTYIYFGELSLSSVVNARATFPCESILELISLTEEISELGTFAYLGEIVWRRPRDE